ncbi:alpha/beta hydrolase [Mesorhizobium sp. Z1-4]|uniref:alpha/beta hydrolase n=1 Tax=Mesorhizobium sp. Z1-4 TaxID=2448478 RepID=UPI000FD7F94A|nr:alpha/beta hydrolase [Mesorhizobium sp. Z1-4]
MNRTFLPALFLLLSTGLAAAQLLPPHKDNLFAYPGLLSADDDGGYRVVDYDEMRDINGRDQTPERRVHNKYVSTGVRREQHDLIAETSAGKVRHIAVGTSRRASVIVVYLHGQGGSRRQGADDFTFGGNFNRIKNLVHNARGLYISPDFSDFGEKGAAEIKALLSIYLRASPEAEVVFACGSMGGALCWRLARDADIAPRLGGLMLLGSLWDSEFMSSAAFRGSVPVFLGHGSRDSVFPIEKMEAFYRSVRKAKPGYPIRMVRFETGSHGTPIRMTDWRETINWMLAQ